MGRSNEHNTLGEGTLGVEGVTIARARSSGGDRALATSKGKSTGLSSVPEPRAHHPIDGVGHVPSWWRLPLPLAAVHSHGA